MKVTKEPSKDSYLFTGIKYSSWKSVYISNYTRQSDKERAKGYFYAKSKVVGDNWGGLLFDDPLGYWK